MFKFKVLRRLKKEEEEGVLYLPASLYYLYYFGRFVLCALIFGLCFILPLYMPYYLDSRDKNISRDKDIVNSLTQICKILEVESGERSFGTETKLRTGHNILLNGKSLSEIPDQQLVDMQNETVNTLNLLNSLAEENSSIPLKAERPKKQAKVNIDSDEPGSAVKILGFLQTEIEERLKGIDSESRAGNRILLNQQPISEISDKKLTRLYKEAVDAVAVLNRCLLLKPSQPGT